MSRSSLLPSRDNDRLYLLDAVRGICVLGMIVYHTLFDVIYAFGISVSPGAEFAVDLIRDLGAALFIFMSGFTFRLGRHHLRHALILSALGLGITAVTYFVMPEMTVIFGIMTFMGAACLLMTVLDRPFSRLPAGISAAVSLLLFLFFISVNFGYCGYGPLVLFRFPRGLYANPVTAFIGFPYNGFSSGDYFSLLPWIFAYFCGCFTYRAVCGRQRVMTLLRTDIPVLRAIGKYSMYIYVIHQPVIYGAVFLLSRLIG